MKRVLSLIICIVMTFSVCALGAPDEITLSLDGELIDCPVNPMIVNGRTMVPFRALFEALSVSVEWNEPLQKVYAMTDDISIILTIGSDKMLVNSEVVSLDAPAFISNGSTLVPARAVCEAMECDVKWDSENRRVVVFTKDYVPPVSEEVEIPVGETSGDPSGETPPSDNPYTPTLGGDPAYIDKNDPEIALKTIELINDIRAQYNLLPVTIDENLQNVAYSHSEDMARRDYMSHESPDGIGPFDRLDLAGIFYLVACENLAAGYTSGQDVVNGWMNSELHRANILNPDFTHIGIGCHVGGSLGVYWTLIMTAR